MERPVILMIDDDAEDQRLVQQAVSDVNKNSRFVALTDGRALDQYMLNQPPYDNKKRYPKPDLVLLDIYMSAIDGWQCLRQLKASKEHASIPTIIYSASSDSLDPPVAYASGANAYIRKPDNYPEIVDVMRAVFGYWLCVVEGTHD